MSYLDTLWTLAAVISIGALHPSDGAVKLLASSQSFHHINMLSLPVFHGLFTPPDLALRQPLTGAAFFPYYLTFYAMAVLVILPHTFIIRLSLLPFVLWQAWRCAVGLDLSAGLALSLGIESGERFNHLNLVYAVRLLSSVCYFLFVFVNFPRHYRLE
jgi:hypothetical protein